MMPNRPIVNRNLHGPKNRRPVPSQSLEFSVLVHVTFSTDKQKESRLAFGADGFIYT